MPRLVSLASAARLLRTTTTSTLTSARLARTTTLSESLSARHNLTKTFSQPQQPQSRFLSSSSRPTVALGLQGQAARGFVKQSLFSSRGGLRSTILQQQKQTLQQTRAFSSRPSDDRLVRKRRFFRVLWRAMVFSTALVAIPAILYLGAPMTTVIFVPIAVGGVVGGALLLTGSLLILILPIVAIGGAAYFLFIAVPASMTVRELNQTIKRSKKDEFATALEALGPDWEIQPARPDEWFHWTFPKTTGSLDKISMRMAVFDPNDHSERKVNTFKWLDRIQDEVDGKEDENNVEVNIIRKKSSKGPSEIRNNSDTMWVENLSFVRENDHFVIEIEDNGANLLSHKWGKNYLELAKIVDRAATEMETADPSVKLGNQVVMVQKNRNDPFWQKFSILGDFALRIPVDRQWVHDVTDE